ncbi:MAG: prepilin-type N-terminal cleavage/methylation domain-containing protein [Lentisphaerae bacterium]|nr:prepilin-type N-terminal cleavage/methylation domain-containing protein [Lentisphaerota bacterium]
MNRIKGRNGRAGLTLVEVMVSIMIFAICIGGICWMMVMSKQLSDRARDHYLAANLAKNRIERGRTLEFDSLDQFEMDEVVVDAEGRPDGNGFFRLTTTVSNVNATLKEIVVEVDIRDRKTWGFEGEREEARTLYADFAEIEE